ncbi:MAG: circadian clock protein KaiC [Calditrichia bacterium]
MSHHLLKKRTHISGFDEITFGGLPEGRITLVCGKQGCGKSIFAQQFLINGARYDNEPGLLVTFEERSDDIIKNLDSFNWDVTQLMNDKLLTIEYIPIDTANILENGTFNLDGLFVRIEQLINQTGAKRVALDTIEAIFAGFSNHAILRAEIARLFNWLKEKNVTVVVTAEEGKDSLTRFNLEEYVSDAVVQLQMNVREDVITRKLAILKYRGSKTGMNLYPFLIGSDGFSILPVTVASLDYQVSSNFISTGTPLLDTMLGGDGIYEGSIILLSGNAGTGKTTITGQFAFKHVMENKRVIYVSTEESKHQLMRNFKTIGMDFYPHDDKNILFYSERPSFEGLEEHLIRYRQLINKYKPDIFILDPISNLISIGETYQVRIMLTRFIDFLRARGITTLFVDFNQKEKIHYGTKMTISSMIDTWIALYNIQHNGKFVREMSIINSRGMAHLNESRRFEITSNGVTECN